MLLERLSVSIHLLFVAPPILHPPILHPIPSTPAVHWARTTSFSDGEQATGGYMPPAVGHGAYFLPEQHRLCLPQLLLRAITKSAARTRSTRTCKKIHGRAEQCSTSRGETTMSQSRNALPKSRKKPPPTCGEPIARRARGTHLKGSTGGTGKGGGQVRLRRMALLPQGVQRRKDEGLLQT